MNAREAERRSGDRRRSDRRGAAHRRRSDTQGAADSSRGGDSFFDPGWLAAGETREEEVRLTRQARRLARAQDSSLIRIYRAYAAARAVIGLGLVAMQGVGSWLGLRTSEWLALVSMAYAAQAITLWLLPRFSPQATPKELAQRRRQWASTIGVDLLAFTCLHALQVGAAFNYAALLVLPVLMAGVLTRRVAALGTAAGVALMLLAFTWHSFLHSPDAPVLLLQSGLAGLGLFMVTLLAGELASRLAREELAARGSLELARQQAQLNRLVIEEMADGVLVVDRRLGVRAANPAARALLVDQGLSVPAPFELTQRTDWRELKEAVDEALAVGNWPEEGRDVTLRFADGLARTLRLRVRFMRGRRRLDRDAGDSEADTVNPPQEPYAVLLLEDLRTLQARIRQEKLAAMGRVSAGIAHEIRNPLMAIGQANALLLEDHLPPQQQRLAQMVADNVMRLKRLVDDVMEVAPGMPPEQQAADATTTVAEAVVDWARTAQIALAPDSRLRTDLPQAPLGVVFDAEHLRRVLVNLLDNAHRHAGAQAGSIFLRLAARDDDSVLLTVLSDGPLIAPEIERYLFEPFFSTRSRGTGLGLYICRELCERYGASIEYRPRPAAERLRNEFAVTMRRAALFGAAFTLPLEPNGSLS